jgi:hypothetical protein
VTDHSLQPVSSASLGMTAVTSSGSFPLDR